MTTLEQTAKKINMLAEEIRAAKEAHKSGRHGTTEREIDSFIERAIQLADMAHKECMNILKFKK